MFQFPIKHSNSQSFKYSYPCSFALTRSMRRVRTLETQETAESLRRVSLFTLQGSSSPPLPSPLLVELTHEYSIRVALSRARLRNGERRRERDLTLQTPNHFRFRFRFRVTSVAETFQGHQTRGCIVRERKFYLNAWSVFGSNSALNECPRIVTHGRRNFSGEA